MCTCEGLISEKTTSSQVSDVDIAHRVAGKISVTLKTDFDFLFPLAGRLSLLLYWARRNQLDKMMMCGPAKATEVDSTMELTGSFQLNVTRLWDCPRSPGRLWHSNRNSGKITVACTCVGFAKRLFGEAWGLFSKG